MSTKKRANFSHPVANITPEQESVGQVIGPAMGILDDWKSGKLFGPLGLKFFVQYIILLYTLPKFFSWEEQFPYGETVSRVSKVLTIVVGFFLLPQNYYIPNQNLYLKSKSCIYSYAEQLVYLLSHMITHFFALEVFGTSFTNSTGNLVLFSCAIFWCIWGHYRLQNARENVRRPQDVYISIGCYTISVIEGVLIFLNIFRSPDVFLIVLQWCILILYISGILFIAAQRLVFAHIKPLMIIVASHCFIQLSVCALFSDRPTSILWKKLLPSGMLIQLLANSLLRDLKLLSKAENEEASVSNAATDLSKLPAFLTVLAIFFNSFIFYYSTDNIFYGALQYCILLWNLADIMTFAMSHRGLLSNLYRRFAS